jgi:predicted Zn-dependent protease
VTVNFVPPAGGVRDVAPLVTQAVELWNNQVGQEVRLQLVNESANADITIRWTSFENLPTNAIGFTEVTFRSADQILSSAEIQIQESLPENFQVQVIAHELGHSLGVDGHSTSESDLMYPNAHLPAAVTTRDRNTVLLSYVDSRSRAESVKASSNGDTLDSNDMTTLVQYICGTHP